MDDPNNKGKGLKEFKFLLERDHSELLNNGEISTSELSRMASKKLNYSYKKMIHQYEQTNNPEKIQGRINLSIDLLDMIRYNKSEFIYVDESGFNLKI